MTNAVLLSECYGSLPVFAQEPDFPDDVFGQPPVNLFALRLPILGDLVGSVSNVVCEPEMAVAFVRRAVQNVDANIVVTNTCRVIPAGAVMANDFARCGPVSRNEPPCVVSRAYAPSSAAFRYSPVAIARGLDAKPAGIRLSDVTPETVIKSSKLCLASARDRAESAPVLGETPWVDQEFPPAVPTSLSDPGLDCVLTGADSTTERCSIKARPKRHAALAARARKLCASGSMRRHHDLLIRRRGVRPRTVQPVSGLLALNYTRSYLVGAL